MGEKWGECEEGEIQGAPMTGFLFRMAIHPYVRELDGALAVGRVTAGFGCDAVLPIYLIAQIRT